MTTRSSSGSAASNPKVPFLDLGESYRELREEYDAAYRRVMDSGWFILGEETEAFETEWAAACGVPHCVGVGSGLDALSLILRAYGAGPGDEVIVPAHTFIATWLSVSHTGARPVPVEPAAVGFNLDPERVAAAVTERTKAIVAVHMYGQPAPMDDILEVASARGLPVVEDAAQAHGAEWRGRRAGGLGNAAAFSFYPVKNLGAFGDGGAVTSQDQQLVERVRRLRNYGSSEKYRYAERGYNSRLDSLQAAFLRVRLRHLDEWNGRRAAAADVYRKGLAGVDGCALPPIHPEATSAWHLFVIRHAQRDGLRAHLAALGIGTEVHYPVPPHLSPAYEDHGYCRGEFPLTESISETVLSLPLNPQLAGPAIGRVVAGVRCFRSE